MNTVLNNIKNRLSQLYSDNLVFREIRKEDIFPFFDANQNDIFSRFLSWNKKTDFEDFKLFFSDKYNKTKDNEEIWVTISEKKSLSWVAFIKMSPYEDVVTGSIYMHPNFWASGYAAEAIKVCAKIYFEESQKNHFFVLVDKEHVLSIKLNMSIGAKVAGEDYMYHENGKKIELVKLKIEKQFVQLPDLTSYD